MNRMGISVAQKYLINMFQMSKFVLRYTCCFGIKRIVKYSTALDFENYKIGVLNKTCKPT